jgi:hypothetical protein
MALDGEHMDIIITNTGKQMKTSNTGEQSVKLNENQSPP